MILYLVLPDSALAPDEDGLHLWWHGFESTIVWGTSNSQLQSNAGMGSHTSALGVATRKKTSESDRLSVPFRLSKTEIPKTFAFQTDVK